MTNIIDSIIDYTLRADSTMLNKVGNMLYVNRQMAINKESFIVKGVTKNSAMRDILMEMKLLLNGRYAGNKDYLFDRMEYLIDCAFQSQTTTKLSIKKSKLTVNRKTVKELKKPVTRARCKKSGKFIARKKRK